MTRSKVLGSVAFLALLTAAAIPVGAAARGSGYGYETGDDDLGWAIFSGDDANMSDLKDMDSMDDLKARFGDEFLYIRVGESRYVIRDSALMERAQEAVRPIREAGREIGEAARVQAEASLVGTRERAKLAARVARLSARIARLERRGEPTGDLEREQEALEQRLGELSNDAQDERAAARQEWKVSGRTKAAKERLHKEVRRVNQEMRNILRDAKSRHLAVSLD